MIFRFFLFLFLVFSSSGCDRIYTLLHKPSNEEHQVLGDVVYNEYNPKVEELQKVLRLFGYTIGRADGKFGASSREAVAKFQEEEGLEVTRLVDKATWTRIQEYVQSPLFHKMQINVKGLQTALRNAGFNPGKIDGGMGPQTQGAVKDFQRAHNLIADGMIGLKTIKALLPYLASSTVGTQENSTGKP
jgi:peptidoglycan hydrolase-like protein with peptidoglycan-binding domain